MSYNETRDMVRALRACRAWHICEQQSIGTLDARMELCNLSEYLVRKALGDDGDSYSGVPRIALGADLRAHLLRADEDQAWALVEEAEAAALRAEKEPTP